VIYAREYLVVSGGGECRRLSQPSWVLYWARYNIVLLTYLLTYLFTFNFVIQKRY